MDERLLEKYRNNRLTEDELKEFLSIARGAGDTDLKKLLDKDISTFVTADNEGADDLTKDRILERLHDFIRPRHRLPLLYKAVTYAASILVPLLAGCCAYMFISLRNDNAISTTINTGQGHLATIELPDSSTVTLNSRSRLNYAVGDFSNNCRGINFEGEALFQIAKQPDRPFVIRTSELKVTVYGTTFNLRAYENDDCASLSLIDGSVSLTSLQSNETIDVKPNQTVTLDYATGQISITPTDPNSNYLAWHDGKLRFTDEMIENVVSQIENCYGCKLIYDGEFDNSRFTGVIPTTNISNAIAILESISSATFAVEWE